MLHDLVKLISTVATDASEIHGAFVLPPATGKNTDKNKENVKKATKRGTLSGRDH